MIAAWGVQTSWNRLLQGPIANAAGRLASANRRQPTHGPNPRLLTPQNSTRAYFSHSLDRFYDGRPPMTFSRHYLAQQAALEAVDLAEVQGCRRAHNQLGFAYQVGFVRLLNRFPKQEPSEVLDELLLFTGMQLGVASSRRPTCAGDPTASAVFNYLSLQRGSTRVRRPGRRSL